MAKFKMRLSLEKFELEIEGSRDDVPIITQAVGQQIAGMLVPATDIVEGEIQPETDGQTAILPVEQKKPSQRKSTSKKPKNPQASANNQQSQPLNWKHDPSKWGTPKQSWTAPEKIQWVLYVASQETVAKELTAPEITKTFETMFREAGKLSNTPRDLSRLKEKAFVIEDTAKSPSKWSLTGAGIKVVQELIARARGSNSE